MSDIIHVNHLRPYNTQDGFITRLIHPEIGRDFPSQYDLASIKSYIHPKQIGCVEPHTGVRAFEVYHHLIDHDLLRFALTLQDAEEIKKLGPDIFRKYFGTNVIFWGSVAEIIGGRGQIWVMGMHCFGQLLLSSWHMIEEKTEVRLLQEDHRAGLLFVI